jgi:broad specificity phosphatase PhoE
MGAMKRLYLVRHGEVDGGDSKVMGHLDLPLSDAGRKAIAGLADSWCGPPPDGFFTSDLCRATESAHILATRLGVAPRVDPRLRELSFGDWEGLTWEEVHRRNGGHLVTWGERWWEMAPPGGESFAELSQRVLAWFREVEAGEVVVAVVHGGSLRALLAALLNLPRSEIFNLRVDRSHVSALAMEAGSWVPLFLNRPRFRDR